MDSYQKNLDIWIFKWHTSPLRLTYLNLWKTRDCNIQPVKRLWWYSLIVASEVHCNLMIFEPCQGYGAWDPLDLDCLLWKKLEFSLDFPKFSNVYLKSSIEAVMPNIYTVSKVWRLLYETRRFLNHKSRLLSRSHTFAIIVNIRFENT